MKKFLTVFFILIFILVFRYKIFSKDNVSFSVDLNYLKFSVDYFKSKDYYKTLYYLEFIKHSDNFILNDYVYYYKAAALYNINKYKESKRNFYKVLKFKESILKPAAKKYLIKIAMEENDIDYILDKCAAKRDSFEKYYYYAALYKKGNKSKAIAGFKEIYTGYPLSDFSKKAYYYIKGDITRSDVINRIDYFYEKKYYKMLLDEFKTADNLKIKLNDNYKFKYFFTLYKNRRYKKAYNVLRKIKKINYLKKKYYLARVYKKRGNKLKYKKLMKEIIKKNSYYSKLAIDDLADYYFKEFKFKTALYYYNKKPGNRARKALCYYFLKDYKNAADKFNLIINSKARIGTKIKAMFLKANCLDKLKKQTQAIEIYNKIISNYPLTYYALQSREKLKNKYHIEREEIDFIDKTNLHVKIPERIKYLAKNQINGFIKEELDAIQNKYKKEEFIYLKSKILNESKEYYKAIKYIETVYPGIYYKKKVNREFLKILYPIDFYNFINNLSSVFQVEPYLAAGIIRQESTFNSNALSYAGAIGLMQIMPGTGKAISKKLNYLYFSKYFLFDPYINIKFGCFYLKQLKDSLKELEYVLAGYNAGPFRVKEWQKKLKYDDKNDFVEAIPYDQTYNYVKKVLRNKYIYKRLYY